jgi:DnaJ family protein A protein 2
LGPILQHIQQQYSDCQGQGETIDPKYVCVECKGDKILSERKILEVSVGKGMCNGQSITFYGEGNQEPNMTPGDIIIELDETPHPIFKRKGNDLFYDAKIDLVTALAGGQFAIPHLDERILLVFVLPGEVIQPGMIKMIPHEGMPAYRHHNHGNLFVKFAINFLTKNWTHPENIAKLNTILPVRPTLTNFDIRRVDDVVLMDAGASESSSSQGEYAHDVDSDSNGAGGLSGSWCAQSKSL